MPAIVSILRAAHCRSTHHYFAIDALSSLKTQRGRKLGKLLLCEHHEYLLGAKAPDTTFRDFQNHVLHVSDNFWGGASQKCDEWLQRSRNHLERFEWNKAAYACGVLSHYFTDPIMPLHTGQSERETVVHRPMEWSVCKSYEDIYSQIQSSDAPQITLSPTENWIGAAVLEAATHAHQHYGEIIELYDLKAGTKKPREGLPPKAQKILADLFHLATNSWAKILDRMANELQIELPDRSLSIPTVLAAIDVPVAWVLNKIHDVHERREVKKIFKEFKSTGKLTKNRPLESKVVAQHVAKHRKQAEKKVAPSKLAKVLQREAVSPVTTGNSNQFSLSSALVDAPSIGPKTAARFQKIGIETVREFVKSDSLEVAENLKTRWINASLIEDWKAQALLVCDVPALCGYKAQLLVAVGCRNAHMLRTADLMVLFSQIKTLANSKAGKRILRSASEPTVEHVRQWQKSASISSGKEAA